MLKSGRWAVNWVAVLVAAMGVLNILSAWLVHIRPRMRLLLDYLPLEASHAGRLVTVLSGIALLLLSVHLYRRKRRAWDLTCIALGAALVAHLVKGLDYEEALVNLALLLGLLPLRPWFTAQSDRPSVRRGLGVLGTVLGATFLYGVAGLFLMDGQFSRDFSLSDAAYETLRHFFEFADAGFHPITHRGRWFLGSLDWVGAASLSYALLQVLRPVVYRRTVTLPDMHRAAEMAARWGRSSLVRLTLLEDKSFFFGTAGQGYIAYTSVGGIAVALGDPVAPASEMRRMVEEFRHFCLENDWLPAFFQVLPDNLGVYGACGMRALKIGEEAIIELGSFTLAGREWKELRHSVNHMEGAGYRTVVYEPPLDAGLLHQLKEVSDEWLAGQTGPEKRFALGWFDAAYLSESPVMAVLDAEGRITAFANILHEYTLNEATVDLMRRRRSVDRSTMDYLFVSLARHFQEKGYAGFNLGLAALAGVGEEADCSLPEKTVKFLYGNFNRFYSFQGLRQYKAKYRPRWEPRYLVYPSVVSLPQVALAIVRANSPEGWAAFARKQRPK